MNLQCTERAFVSFIEIDNLLKMFEIYQNKTLDRILRCPTYKPESCISEVCTTVTCHHLMGYQELVNDYYLEL